MATYLDRVMVPFQSNMALWNMGYGAIGGMLGAGLVSATSTGKIPPLMGRFMVESAVIGAITNYLLLVTGFSTDIQTTPRSMLMGAAGQFVWYRFARPMAVNWQIVA